MNNQDDIAFWETVWAIGTLIAYAVLVAVAVIVLHHFW